MTQSAKVAARPANKAKTAKPRRTSRAKTTPASSAKPAVVAEAAPVAPAPTPAPAPVAPAAPDKALSKRDQLAALLLRDEGAAIDQMTAATGWLPHTVRAALTGLKKRGYGIDSDKVDGVRTYRAVAPQ